MKDFFKNTFFRRYFRRLVFMWQILIHGWCECDTWSLDCSIAKFVLPRLKKFRELNNGHPGDLTEKKWDVILDKMIFSMEKTANDQWEFSEVLDDKSLSHKQRSAKMKKINDKILEGHRLFGQYFCNLWW